MRKAFTIQLMSEGAWRIEIQDEPRAGWQLVLHPPPGDGHERLTLRTPGPDGFQALLAEARARIAAAASALPA